MTSQPLEQKLGEGMIMGDRERYNLKCDDGFFPSEIAHLKHSIEWPVNIDFTIKNFHRDYVSSHQPSHDGVDILVPAGTPIFAPESGLIRIDNIFNYGRLGANEACAFLRAENSGVLYILGHLNRGDIPRKIRKTQNGSFVHLEKGDYIGKIIKRPVSHWIDHLHIKTAIGHGNPTEPFQIPLYHQIEFNPLLLFQKAGAEK